MTGVPASAPAELPEEPNRLAEAYKALYGEELKLSDGCETVSYTHLMKQTM